MNINWSAIYYFWNGLVSGMVAIIPVMAAIFIIILVVYFICRPRTNRGTR